MSALLITPGYENSHIAPYQNVHAAWRHAVKGGHELPFLRENNIDNVGRRLNFYGGDRQYRNHQVSVVEAFHLVPDSPDEMASGQLRAPIPLVRSILYAGSDSGFLTDATGERRNGRFRQLAPVPLAQLWTDQTCTGKLIPASPIAPRIRLPPRIMTAKPFARPYALHRL